MPDAGARRAARKAAFRAGVGEGGRMIVDGSYMAWVRPTHRVHLALSVGMTVTGVILAAVGLTGGGGAARTSPALGPSADAVVSGGSGLPAGAVPPAPLVRFAPPAPAAPAASSGSSGSNGSSGKSAKPHPKPDSAGRHAVPESVPAQPGESAPPAVPAAPAAPVQPAAPAPVHAQPAHPQSTAPKPAPAAVPAPAPAPAPAQPAPAAAPAPHRSARPSDVSRPAAPASSRSSEPFTRPAWEPRPGQPAKQ